MLRTKITGKYSVYTGSKEEITNLFFSSFEKPQEGVKCLAVSKLEKFHILPGSVAIGAMVGNIYRYRSICGSEVQFSSEAESIREFKASLAPENTHYLVAEDSSEYEKNFQKLKVLVL